MKQLIAGISPQAPLPRVSPKITITKLGRPWVQDLEAGGHWWPLIRMRPPNK